MDDEHVLPELGQFGVDVVVVGIGGVDAAEGDAPERKRLGDVLTMRVPLVNVIGDDQRGIDEHRRPRQVGIVGSSHGRHHAALTGSYQVDAAGIHAAVFGKVADDSPQVRFLRADAHVGGGPVAAAAGGSAEVEAIDHVAPRGQRTGIRHPATVTATEAVGVNH